MPSIAKRIAALLGVSAYGPLGPGYGPSIDDEIVKSIRKSLGGNIQQIPVTKLRWYLADLENAQAQADAGFLALACQLYRAMARDGTLSGLLSTRTSGLVRMPKRFYGSDERIVDDLRAKNGSRSVFDEMCPPTELAALAADGDVIGVGVAELVPVPGREYPVLVRLDPEFLQYMWQEGRWYYISRAGRLPITPGDGHWVLHVPGGRIAPWRWGLWPALGRAFINKEHAIATRAGFIASVANPARVIETPLGANEVQRKAFFAHVLRWGPNTVLEVPAGWQAKLLELTGRAWEVFQKEIDTCDQEFMVALAGQIVTTTGGAGFQNSDVQRVIRGDLIKSSAENLAYTLNTQVLPWYAVGRYGDDAIDAGTSVEWDTNLPKDREAESRTLVSVAAAIGQLVEVLGKAGRELDVDAMCTRFDIPLKAQTSPAAAVADQPLEEGTREVEPDASTAVSATKPAARVLVRQRATLALVAPE